MINLIQSIKHNHKINKIANAIVVDLASPLSCCRSGHHCRHVVDPANPHHRDGGSGLPYCRGNGFGLPHCRIVGAARFGLELAVASGREGEATPRHHEEEETVRHRWEVSGEGEEARDEEE